MCCGSSYCNGSFTQGCVQGVENSICQIYRAFRHTKLADGIKQTNVWTASQGCVTQYAWVGSCIAGPVGNKGSGGGSQRRYTVQLVLGALVAASHSPGNSHLNSKVTSQRRYLTENASQAAL